MIVKSYTPRNGGARARLLSTSAIPTRKFRLMKDETGNHGGGNQGGTGDNGGGNGGAPGGDSQQQNNDGQKFDLASFWNSPDDEANKGAPSGDSATPTPSPSGQPQQQNQPNPTVAAIQNMEFAAPVMTDDVMKELAEGKTEGFHKALTQHGRQVAEQTIRTVLPIMAQLRDQLRTEMRQEVTGTLSNRDNMKDLFQAIPSADTPALRPQVTSIFERAMSHSKGDRKAAIELTKDMLRLTSTSMEADLGIPPRSPGDGTAAVPSKTNWLDELAGRG